MKKIAPQNIIFIKPIYAFLVFILLLVFSCASKKTILKTEPIVEVNPKLIFLNYMLTENVDGIKKIDFISKTIAEGRVRHNKGTHVVTGQIGDLKCSQLDNESQILQSVFIKNPLNKTVEYISDSLEFKSEVLALKKAPLSLRLPLKKETTSIIISEIVDTLQNTKPLFVTKLQTK